MAGQTAPSPKSEAPREWAPRIWEGTDFFGWMRLLVRNRFAVEWRYFYIAVIVTIVSFFHTVLRGVQFLLYGERIRQISLTEPPIFVIGHWRTGTTLLHELLCLDERHTFPNYYQCMDPNHFLLTEGLITRWLHFLMPTRRPMDNMAAGWHRPQEDEFALCMIGLPSPYLTIAFPNHPPQYAEYLDLQDLKPRELATWKRKFLWFLKQLTFKGRRRLVLKSPTHTARIKVLLELCPDARFVHIVRDPFVVFPSTVNLWKALYRTHGLQTPRFEGLDEQVLATAERLYARLEEGRCLVPAQNFYEVRYEDLVKDPVGQMRRLYDFLGLGAFEVYLPHLERYLESVRGYETNKYQLTPQQREAVVRRWGPIFSRYGYDAARSCDQPAS